MILGIDVLPETSWWMIAPSVFPNRSGQKLSKDLHIFSQLDIATELDAGTILRPADGRVVYNQNIYRRCTFWAIHGFRITADQTPTWGRLRSSTPWRFHRPQKDCWAKKPGRLAQQWLVREMFFVSFCGISGDGMGMESDNPFFPHYWLAPKRTVESIWAMDWGLFEWKLIFGRDSKGWFSDSLFHYMAGKRTPASCRRLGLSIHSIRGWHWLLVHESPDFALHCPRLSGRWWEVKSFALWRRSPARICALRLPGNWWAG